MLCLNNFNELHYFPDVAYPAELFFILTNLAGGMGQ